jgi:hypothetical protein
MTTSYEQRVLTWLQHRLLEQEPGIWSGDEQIRIEDVRLEPRNAEGDELVILFRDVQRPHCLFGFRTDPSPPQVLTADGSLVLDEDPEGLAEILYVNLKESVEAADMGLPKECIDNGVTWI